MQFGVEFIIKKVTYIDTLREKYPVSYYDCACVAIRQMVFSEISSLVGYVEWRAPCLWRRANELSSE